MNPKGVFINSKRNERLLFLLSFVLTALIACNPSFAANFDTAIQNIQGKVTGVILPSVAVIGVVFAAFSLITGNPNSKIHIIYAIFGCIFGFGASGIVGLIRDTVR